MGRQNGAIVSHNAQKFSLNPFDVVVLATKRDDMQMSKNGGAVLIAAGWSTDAVVRGLGIEIASVTQLQETINLGDHCRQLDCASRCVERTFTSSLFSPL